MYSTFWTIGHNILGPVWAGRIAIGNYSFFSFKFEFNPFVAERMQFSHSEDKLMDNKNDACTPTLFIIPMCWLDQGKYGIHT